MSSVLLFSIILCTIPVLQGDDLTGVVCDLFGSPIDGTVVELVSVDKTVNRVVKSRADGAFHIEMVPPGAYTVTFRKQGYHQKRYEQHIAGDTRSFTVGLQHGRLYIPTAHVIRGSLPRRQNIRAPSIVKAVAAFDHSIRLAARVTTSGLFTLRMRIPGDYLVGVDDELQENLTKCRYRGDGDLSIDLRAKTCVPVQR